MTTTRPGRRRATSRDAAGVSEPRLFGLAVLGFAVLFTVIGLRYGQAIALQLQDTPTTDLGWRLIGWGVAGPPWLLTMITWHERARFRPEQLRRRGVLLAAWIGLSMLVLPSRLTSVEQQFGTGALVGEPLSTGWGWGALGALVGLVFTGLVLLVLHRSVHAPTTLQRDQTVRFLERAWLVLLLVSLGFALYGSRTDMFQGGT